VNFNSASRLRETAQIIFAGVWLIFALACQAQSIVDCVIQGKVQTPSVRGTVVDPTGVPVPDTLVVLELNGEKVRQAKTDSDGKFNLNASAGTYSFKMTHPDFAGITIDLVVGKDMSNTFSRSGLYVVLGLPGSFCPMVWTNSDKLHRMREANKRHIEETSKNNATQK